MAEGASSISNWSPLLLLIINVHDFSSSVMCAVQLSILNSHANRAATDVQDDRFGRAGGLCGCFKATR